MANPFTCLGFPVGSVGDFAKLSAQAARNGQFIKTDAGTYKRWTVGGGPQLWVDLNDADKIMGFDPHFVGRARMHVRLTQRVKQPNDSVLEGAFYAWANPWVDGPYGDTPLVFRVPDFARHNTLKLPVDTDVQIAAFPHSVSAYASDAEYAAGVEGKAHLATEAFIPSGTFKPSGESIVPPQPYAIINGHVLRAALCRNPVTGLHFHWAQVRTYGGEYDIVVDADTLKGPLVVGGVISGSFWLSGQIIEPSEDRLL
jgi:hypothetical protein